MKNINHLSPIYNCFFKKDILLGGRTNLKKYLVLRLLEQKIPELIFNTELDFPFNPKLISKVKNRKIRRACYQAFSIYKKSFKPLRLPRLRIFKDEIYWLDDHVDAVSHLFINDDFRRQYLGIWE
ncbi:hypothetical protein [Acinetobacter calcoaceticus]|uniref:hypothetical protein n=1 Tax=Acinetobacter calcoaceticus TaxID=471 RepID=UPI0018DC0579|nr:hypothetical protein [Acinetobacter calcoaceticus]